MRERVELDHERADLVLVKLFKITGPVVLVAETPNDHRRMIAMLIDEIAQHAARLFLVAFAAEAAATPRNLLPHEQAQLVAHFEHRARLLVMAEPDEVSAEIFDQPHLLADL